MNYLEVYTFKDGKMRNAFGFEKKKKTFFKRRDIFNLALLAGVFFLGENISGLNIALGFFGLNYFLDR